jgi:hypothetical protein
MPAIIAPPMAQKMGSRLVMKTLYAGVAIAFALGPLSASVAENQLPPTTVTAPKPNAVKRTQNPAPSHRPDNMDAALPERPDPETPNIRARDWNAPGMLNLHYMTEAQFDAFKAAHPTVAFYGRCFAGQDPDPNIRASFLRRVPHGCGG